MSAGYIEKDRPGEWSNPTSCTVEINPEDTSTLYTSESEEQENLQRWDWLISGWDKMSFKEKLAIFLPYLHYVDLRDIKRADFEESINNEMAELSYKLCRNFEALKFDPDRQGIPRMIFEFAPIDPDFIPDASLKNTVKVWGRNYGYYLG